MIRTAWENIVHTNKRPTAWWRLGSAIGHDEMSANPATIVGALTHTDDGPIVDDGVGSVEGWSFANNLTIPYSAALNPAVGVPFSVSVWVRLDVAAGVFHTIYNGLNVTSADGGFLMRIGVAGNLLFGVSDGIGYSEGGGATDITDGEWHLCIGVYDGTSRKTLVDGVQTSTAVDGYIPSPSGAHSIGSRNGLPFSESGEMSEMILWNGLAITEAMAARMYEIGRREHSDLTDEHMGWLPRYLQNSTDTYATIEALARESEHMLDQLEDFGRQMFVQTATWGLRSWEQRYKMQAWDFGDPLAPSDEDRRAAVLAKMTSNRAVSGAEFRAVMDKYTTNYSIQMDHATGTLNFTIAYDPSSDSADALEDLIRSITPAHLNVNFQYTAFLAGISAAGDAV